MQPSSSTASASRVATRVAAGLAPNAAPRSRPAAASSLRRCVDVGSGSGVAARALAGAKSVAGASNASSSSSSSKKSPLSFSPPPTSSSSASSSSSSPSPSSAARRPRVTAHVFGGLGKLFGGSDASERTRAKYQPMVDAVNALESSMAALSDADLRSKTDELRARAVSGNAELDDLLPEAFAVVREASKRVLGLRPFDVQLIGGAVLHSGQVAEMRTGEGKTLVAVLPAYLNALTGKGVHVVTVNDYLARRDSEWVGQVHKFLGLTVGLVQAGLDEKERKEAYNCDITYVTNSELGFDYLRDNLASAADDLVLRKSGFNFCVIDEVDSILIDEARTPLIISGPAEKSSEKYVRASKLAGAMAREVHYTVDEKQRSVLLTEGEDCFWFGWVGREKKSGKRERDREIGNARSRASPSKKKGDEKNKQPHPAPSKSIQKTTPPHPLSDGYEAAEDVLGVSDLYDPREQWASYVINALKAKELHQRDVHYIVAQGGEVVIVDEFTGRTMPGRRWGDGLHQAIEAKEGVEVQDETVTLASISYQNFFRAFPKLAGMTGTAATEAAEFANIYGLDVSLVPTNRPACRKDSPDVVFRTEGGKWGAAVAEVKRMVAEGRPVLVG